MEHTRVDRWLWSIRLFKTRSAAAEACRGGHVSVNGRKAKPAAPVSVGDRVAARVGDAQRIVEVLVVIDRRVGAKIATECYADHSPPPPPRDPLALLEGVRDAGAGRPTKRDRRQMEQLRGRGRRR